MRFYNFRFCVLQGEEEGLSAEQKESCRKGQPFTGALTTVGAWKPATSVQGLLSGTERSEK